MTGLTFRRVFRSEWTKLLSLRSNWFLLVGVPALLVGLAALIGWNARAQESTPTQAVGGGFLLFGVLTGVLGLLTVTGEHGSGAIRATLITVPRRLPVLWAKAAVLLAITTPVLVVAYVAALLAHQAFADPAVRITLGDPGVVRAILGVAAATVACGLIGLATGTLLRSTAGAITTYVAVLVFLPQLLGGVLPVTVQEALLPYLPTWAMQAMFQIGDAGVLLVPGAGGLVVLGWVILLLGGAAAVLDRRDA
jgi:hypothetical protein